MTKKIDDAFERGFRCGAEAQRRKQEAADQQVHDILRWVDKATPTPEVAWHQLATRGTAYLRQSFGKGTMFEVVEPFITTPLTEPCDDCETYRQYGECTCCGGIDASAVRQPN